MPQNSELDRVPKVLLVEDSLTDAEVLIAYLKQAGIAVVKVSSSEEACLILQHHQLDLVVLDIMLPGRSGFELCHELKTGLATEHIPVILCSTRQTSVDKLWGSLLGADAYLPKPIDQDELLHTIAELTQLKGLTEWKN
ncbi:response regulator transcription factor [Leptolyngbya ohadii]|uniref:response regulator transcription factor n=1 Tax=Leptolyngbya ohadii TaxID=1962290 RepID=UPI000B59EF1A|nr:response regulator [Leptolyngbya ohadii]